MGLLRTLLALAVVFAHSSGGYIFVGGKNAVQLFYIISGFLISHVIHTNTTYQNPLRFYATRALRLFPIYYVVALLSLGSALLLPTPLFAVYQDIPSSARMLLIGSNLLIFGQDWVMFSGIQQGMLVFTSNFRNSDVLLYDGLLVPQAWTLGLELSFYAIAPFILRKKGVLLLLLACSLSIRVGLMYLGLGDKDPWSYRFFPAELSLFLLGALSNQYLLPLWKRIVSVPGRTQIPRIVSQLLVAITTFYFIIPGEEEIKSPLLVVLLIVSLPLTFLHQSTSSLDKAIGELSYPIYIGHLLIIRLFAAFLNTVNWQPNLLVLAFGNAFLACVFALLLNKTIGRPIEALRSRVKARPGLERG